MLIGAGIGVVPFASIAREFCSEQSKVKRIYWTIIAREAGASSWIRSELLQLAEKAEQVKQEVHVQVFYSSPEDITSMMMFYVGHKIKYRDVRFGSEENQLAPRVGCPDWKFELSKHGCLFLPGGCFGRLQEGLFSAVLKPNVASK